MMPSLEREARTPDTPLNPVDQRERLPYRGRVGVFFGGSGQTGATAAAEYQKLGGRIILGASSERTLNRGLSNIRMQRGDRSSVIPLVGDVTNQTILTDNIAGLVEKLDTEGTPVTDVFTFQASGIPFAIELDEQYLGPMNEIVATNPPDAQERLATLKAELKERYKVWLPESEDDARAVNFQSKVNIINAFIDVYKGKRPLTFTDFNSIFGKEGAGPGFYGNVHKTKHEFCVWFGDNAERLAGQNIDTQEIVGPVEEDTDVGKIFLFKVNPVLDPNVAGIINRTKVKRVHVFGAMRQFIDMPRDERAQEGRPYVRYVVGDNGVIYVVRSIPEELRIDPAKFDI